MMNPAILLVDDEKAICSALNRTFRKNNFQVFEANSGEQALDVLEKNTIDVIVSDQRMPGMTGTQLLSVVKNRYPRVGRIILSGHSDVNDLAEAINEANVYRFLPKPWDEKLLVDTVNNAIPQNYSKTMHFNPLQVGLNKSSPERKPKKAIAVSIKEAALQKQIDLEVSISNNNLLLKEQAYHNNEAPLHYLDIVWPKFNRFNHEGIINIASQSGCLHSLFHRYLLNVVNHLKKHSNKKDLFVVDLFFETFPQDHILVSLLGSLLEDYPNLIFRTPFESLQKDDFTRFLLNNYYANGSLILDVGKRVIDISELQNTPVLYVEMDGGYTAINNHLLTEKRLKMLTDAQNLGIKTILSKDQTQTQYNYANTMGFDFF